MDTENYTHLEIREMFHLECLRRFAQKLKPGRYVLKGGVNMRLFFQSPRYSEDMDLDAKDISVHDLRDTVMGILAAPSLRDALSPFGVRSIVLPDMTKAKQTGTTQRFKVHLEVSGGVDLFTKIEFSRRGTNPGAVVEQVPEPIVRRFRMPPIMCPHYDAEAAWLQKISALAGRPAVQARDIFDLYLLDTQAGITEAHRKELPAQTLKKAADNALAVEFDRFKDTVLAYFTDEDRRNYDDPARWDDIRLTVSRRIERFL